MVYTQKNIKNGLQTLLVGNISNSDTLLTITTGEGGMFPSNNTPLVLEQFNTSGACFKREVVNLVSKSGDILTVSRAYEESVQDDTATPKTITQNALSFNLDQGIVKISQYMTAKIFDDLENEVVQVRVDFQDADLLKSNRCNIVTVNTNYTFDGDEADGTVFSMDTSGGNRTFTLNPALFPTTNGCFIFTFTKSTSDANTVTIDVGSGNTIDGSQTYILTVQNESVTIVIQSSTFAKVIGASNKPIILATETFQKSIIAGENITAGRMVRMGKITNIDIGVGNITQSNGAGSSTNFNISSTTAFCEIGQSFIANIGFLSGFSVWVKRLGNIAVNWNLELFSDAGFSTLIATSTNSFAQSSLTTTSTEFVFNFANIPLVQGSTYYAKMNSSNPGGGVNASNYVIVEHSGTSLYSDGIAYSISSTGVVTSLSGNDLRFNVAYFLPEDTSRIYQTNSSIQGKIDYIGMSLTTTTSGNSCPILFAGCIPTTGLTVGREYYLNGTAGQVGVIPGTFGKLIGFSIAATSLLLYENIKKEDSLLALRSSIAASGTVTYTHALGRVPTIIDVKSIIGGTSIPGKSLGTWLGNGSNACVYAGASSSGVIDTTFSIRLWDATSRGQTGVIQNVTATSFDIVWTYAATPSTYDFALIFILS